MSRVYISENVSLDHGRPPGARHTSHNRCHPGKNGGRNTLNLMCVGGDIYDEVSP